MPLTKRYNLCVLGKLKKNILFAAAFVGNYRVALPFFRLFKKRYPRLTEASTEICIEGFPRSGNTYFVSAFMMWNKTTQVAHHSHLAGSVKNALERGVPTVLLIRDPAECVASVLAWDGLLTVTMALASYVHFHRQLWKHKERCLVLCFEDVVQQPGACIKLINDRFGLDFERQQLTGSVDQEIRDRLENVDDHHNRSATNSTLPNPAKLEIKQAYQHRLTNNHLWSSARIIYSNYKTSAVKPDIINSTETRSI